VDQGISASQGAQAAPSYALRLVLIFFGAVFGMLLLSFVFGSTSASADDGDDGLLTGLTETVSTTVAEVAEPVQATVAAVTQTATQTVTTVTHAAPAATVTTPVAATVDAVLEPVVGDALGTAPVTTLLEPVVKALDGTVAAVGDTIVPVVSVIGPAVPQVFDAAQLEAAAASTAVAATAVAVTAQTLVSGVATGALDLTGGLSPAGDDGTSGTTVVGTGLVAAFLAAGFFVLLASRRQLLPSRVMPGSPVYATDSSPD
jgi:hypothetical protein